MEKKKNMFEPFEVLVSAYRIYYIHFVLEKDGTYLLKNSILILTYDREGVHFCPARY